MIAKALEYVKNNEGRFLEELKEFLRFPSVSADSRYKKDVVNCAKWLVEHFKKMGMESRLIETKGHPIVWAEKKTDSDKKLIFYGHYDVQPADPVDKWETKPFDPVVRDGFIYARGATDDKGQLFAHVKAVESLLKGSSELPCNVLFLIEGEEESGGDNLAEFVRKEKSKLGADAVVVSDSSMYDEETPAITYGLRGIVCMEIKVTTASGDLHSGVYGGGMGNANTAIAHILSKCISSEGEVLIEGFYDDVRGASDWEKENIKSLCFDEKKFLKEAGVEKTFGQKGYPVLERLWARPTLEINGLYGGYTQEGMKTVIPCSATAKLSMRVVHDQKPREVFELAAKHIRRVCGDYAKVEITGPVSAAEAVLFDVDNAMIQAGYKALEKGYGAKCVYIRSGGSIPVVNTFWQELKQPVVLMGFGLDSDGAHSVNEKFKVDNFINGIRSSVYLLGEC